MLYTLPERKTDTNFFNFTRTKIIKPKLGEVNQSQPNLCQPFRNRRGGVFKYVECSGYSTTVAMTQTMDPVAGCDVVQSEISKESRSAGNSNNNNNVVRCCAGCGCKIVDRFLLHAVDRFWHTGCLKCSCCSVQLGEVGPSCFSKGGMILCKKDYIRLFGVSGACSACAQQIPANELVMRTHNKVYHLKCFSCSSCHIQLVPGDRYTLINGSLVCENDHSKFFKAHGVSSAVSGFRPGNKVC